MQDRQVHSTSLQATLATGSGLCFRQRIPDNRCAHYFVAAGIVFTNSSIFQGIGNTVPPLLSSMTRLLLFVAPAILLARSPGFQIRHLWYLSVGSQLIQACINLLLLQRELRKKLTFTESQGFVPGSATAS